MKGFFTALLLALPLVSYSQSSRVIIESGLGSYFKKSSGRVIFGGGISLLQPIGQSEDNYFRIDGLLRSVDSRLSGQVRAGVQVKRLSVYGFHQVFSKKSSDEVKKGTLMGIGLGYNILKNVNSLEFGYEHTLGGYFGRNNLGVIRVSYLREF